MEIDEQTDKFFSKEEQLLRWCRQKKIFSKAEVISYGTQNYYLRAERTIRDFVLQGIVRKIGKEECIRRNLKGNIAWYEVVSSGEGFLWEISISGIYATGSFYG